MVDCRIIVFRDDYETDQEFDTMLKMVAAAAEISVTVVALIV